MGGSISIKNDTQLPLLISLEQLTPLYWQVVKPGETFYRETGAVHFTIKAKVALEDTINVVKDCVLPIAAVSTLGIGVAGLALATIPAAIRTGVVAGVLGVQQATVQTASTVGTLITTGSVISQIAIFSTFLAIQHTLQQMLNRQGKQKLDQVIPSDQIRQLVRQNLKKQHYRIKKCGYYAGYNHKLKITGGISLQKLLHGQYYAQQLKIIPL